ncbi:MAG TPA: hypothetical protein VJ570_03900 [Holophagaceae bacterium]|nr:hypothetical protein [Holophagaceae bacterium]
MRLILLFLGMTTLLLAGLLHRGALPQVRAKEPLRHGLVEVGPAELVRPVRAVSSAR